MGSVELSVIVPVYDPPDSFYDLVRILDEQRADFDYEIIVVDDYSPGNIGERIRRIGTAGTETKIRFKRMNARSGPAAARNAAIAEARSSLFYCVDADCRILDGGFLSKVRQAALKYPKAIVGGPVSGIGSGYAAFCDSFCHWVTNIPGTPDGPARMGHMVTANMIIPRGVWEKSGPFDEDLLTGEDVAFCMKARKAGVELLFDSTLTVEHHDREDWKSLLQCMYRVGKDRANVRLKALGSVPWYLGGHVWIRWILVPFMVAALTIYQLGQWMPYRRRVLGAVPGLILGMTALACGVAVGRRRVC